MSVWAEVAGKREKREWPSISSLAFFRRGVAVSGEREVSRALLGRRETRWG